MYRIGPGIKQHPERRWALRERMFFACGACHILAFAFLERYPRAGFVPIWQKPAAGFTGNHIFVTRDNLAFDYHGYSDRSRLIAHTHAKANRWWPGWDCEFIELPKEVLISEAKSREYDGLWLREPLQFLHDARPRAERFLDRFPPPGQHFS
jgi:hypothetical protein